MKHTHSRLNSTRARRLAFAIILLAGGALSATCQRKPATKTFPTPEDAVRAVVAAVENRSADEVEAIVGPTMVEALDLDNVDREGIRKIFIRAARAQIKIEADPEDPTRQIAYLGRSEWPFPAPLVRHGNAWRFDGDEGAVEVTFRRIGRNELAAAAMTMGYVDAQEEYAAVDRDGDGTLEYATRVNSTPGLKDGLYWSTDTGEDLSPVGPFAAVAVVGEEVPGGKSEPLNGYWGKMLARTGSGTPATEGVPADAGSMPPFVLWPDEYGFTGIMTFAVNDRGEAFEKDFGEDTSKLVKDMSALNLDSSWKRVEFD